jgi:heme A synthase
MAHRLGGAVLGLVAIVSSLAILRGTGRAQVGVRRAALLVPVAVLAQVTLGVLVIATYRSIPIVVAHFGCAALLWGLFSAMWLMTGSSRPAPQRASARAVERGELAPGGGRG